MLSVDRAMQEGRPVKIIEKLKLSSTVNVFSGQATITLVGERLRHEKRLREKITSILQEFDVKMISDMSSPISFTFILDNGDADRAVRTLHQSFYQQSEE